MRDLHIATGASFYDAPANQTFSWPSLVRLLMEYDIGAETLQQYTELSKGEQLKRKDRGWFNGNTYSAPSRQTELIERVDLLALDVDNGGPDVFDQIEGQLDPIFGDDGFAHFVGSTRKHTSEHPRLRLVIPLAAPVTVDQADALKRMIAFRIGMKAFDRVSFVANQVMFWPSRCIDGEQFARVINGPWLDAEDALRRWYPNGWANRESWPLHTTEERDALTHQRKKAGDPLEKPGTLGVFCRTYSIREAMAEFLPAAYVPGSADDRWTHAGGTTADGAIIYDDKWLYSHHQTDPGAGRLLNAWDLVRVHKFGALDAKSRSETPVQRLPSSKAMEDFVRTIPSFRRALGEDATLEFGKVEDTADKAIDEDARKELAELLDVSKGRIVASLSNLVLILRKHPMLAGALAYNHNTDAKVWLRFMPWHDTTRRSRRMHIVDGLSFVDADEHRLRDWMATQYRMEETPLQRIREAVTLVADENGFHPIKDHIRALPVWDGIPRLDTLFVRYLNAEDTPYTREAARRFCIGMIKRVMEPGCKFDTMLLLIGVQRIRKSAFLECLAGGSPWFSDDLPKLGKEAVEHIRSLWLVEVAELAQFSRTETEFIKAFLSRRHDRARLAYEQNVRTFPRQTVFAGTTNNFKPLKDQTGNGRYLPIVCRDFVTQRVMIDVEAFAVERDQVMAEARAAWAAGETAHITDIAALDGAAAAQADAMVEDPITAQIDAWLDGDAESRRAPSGVANLTAWQQTAQRRRDVTCLKQIAVEALGYDEGGKDWPTWLTARITDHMHNKVEWGKTMRSLRVEHYGKPKVFERTVAVKEPVDDVVITL